VELVTLCHTVPSQSRIETLPTVPLAIPEDIPAFIHVPDFGAVGYLDGQVALEAEITAGHIGDVSGARGIGVGDAHPQSIGDIIPNRPVIALLRAADTGADAGVDGKGRALVDETIRGSLDF